MLGTIASVSQAASYPSLALANSFVVTGSYGTVANSLDANNIPYMTTYASGGFKGTNAITVTVNGQ